MRAKTAIPYSGATTQAVVLMVTAVGQSSAILRVSGDSASGIIYAAVRQGGQYQSTDQSLVASGTGADWYENLENAYYRSFVVSGLTPGTTYWYGIYRDTGNVTPVTSDSFVTSPELPDPTDGKALPIGD